MRNTWFSALAVFFLAGIFVVACGPEDDGNGTDGNDTGVESEDTGMGGNGDTDGNGGMDADEGGETGTDGGNTERFVVENCSEVTAATEVTVGPGLTYEPTDATVPAGKVVKWSWADGVNQPHDVTADNDADCSEAKPSWFQSETTADTGYNFCVRFNETGEWNYQCTVPGHCGGGMKGTITAE